MEELAGLIVMIAIFSVGLGIGIAAGQTSEGAHTLRMCANTGKAEPTRDRWIECKPLPPGAEKG